VCVQSGGFYTARMETPMAGPQTLGFIGTGVMGEPMCRNLAAKSGRRVLAWDPASAPI
jgi:phosphoglycerate dehydrogenase-like enzyme